VKTSSKSSVKGAAAKAAPKVAVKVATHAKTAAPSANKPVAPAKAKPAPVKVKPLTAEGKAKAQPSVKTKMAAKSPAKPAAQAKLKPAVKLIQKAPVKAMSKTPAKTPAKTPVKTKTVAVSASQIKPAVKRAAPEAVKANPKNPPVKTAAKSAVKTPLLPAPKEVLKPAKATAKAPIATPPVKVKSSLKAAASTVAVPAAVVKLAEPVPLVAGDVPARATRPSARLAQITVPSMAQSVASTAAKASYLHNTPTQVMTPVFTASIKKDPKLANNWKTKKADELSDPEILAMSDDFYMNDAQMAYFRWKLVILKNEILASAGQTTENLREDTVVVPDPADRATIEEEHALELRTRDRERKLLKKIEQSIIRIDAGDYGYCDETGEPIGVGRLLARPTATLSLEAQQRRELKQKMFGD
jgi:DnaK suppressor protein